MKLRDILLQACRKYNYDPPLALVHLREKDTITLKIVEPGAPGAPVLNLVKKKP